MYPPQASKRRQSRTQSLWRCLENPKENANDNGNRTDRSDLPLEVSLGSFFDGAGDLTHPFIPGDNRMTALIKKKGGQRARPAIAQTIEIVTPEIQSLRARKVIMAPFEVGHVSEFLPRWQRVNRRGDNAFVYNSKTVRETLQERRAILAFLGPLICGSVASLTMPSPSSFRFARSSLVAARVEALGRSRAARCRS